MNEQMKFPETFERFAKTYGFKDDEEVYTNGLDLIPIFRVKQWLEHDNKLRIIETDTAYECGKHANKWIPVRERLPENHDSYLVTTKWKGSYSGDVYIETNMAMYREKQKEWDCVGVIAWMPLPEPYKGECEE